MFVKVRRKKKALFFRASYHYSSNTSKKFMNLWKIYVQLRKTKKGLYNRAYDIANISLTRRTWRTWCLMLNRKRLDMQSDQYATSHYNDIMLKKVWKTWCSHYSSHVKVKQLSQLADEKLVFSLTKKHFLHWREYIRCRRRKYALYDKARKLYNLSLKHKIICVWWTRYEKVLEYRDKLITCQALGIKATKQRFFSEWTVYVNVQINQRRQQAIAQIHHRRLLLRRSFECLRFFVLFKQRKIHMLYTAQKFNAISLLKSSWQTWQRRVESIEEIELDELSSVARDHHRSKLARKTFKALIDYHEWKKSRKKNMMKAETHFIFKAFPRYFNHWRRYVDEVTDINQMKKDADNFRRELLCTKYFYAWYSAYEEVQEDRTRERMAVMMFTENTLRHHFDLWRHKNRIILSSNHNDAVARVHYRRSLLHIGIKHWIRYTEDSLLRKRKLDQADSYYKESLRAGAWLSWKNYTNRCRQKKEKINKALELNDKHLLQKSLSAWILGWNKAKAIQLQAQQKYNSKCLQIMQESFSEWRKNAAVVVEKRESRKKALYHRHHQLQSLVFTHWRQWIILQRFKNEQKQETLIRAVETLKKFKIQRCFHFWRESKDSMKLENLHLSKARQHYYTRVCKIVFQAWQIHNYIMLKKKLMQRQGAVLRRSIILRNCTEKWRNELQEKYDAAAKTGDALWHWAMALQGRCFDNWRSYIAERKRKKRRYDQAMDARRYYIIKAGCVQMLQYHANALAQRTQYEACQQAKARYNAYHLAWKYGKRWINKVRQKMVTAKHLPYSSTAASFGYEPVTERVTSTSNLKPWLPIPSPIVKERLSTTEVFQPLETYYQPREPIEKHRPSPRLPDFLDDSLRREGIFNEYLTTDIPTSSELSPRRVQSYEMPLEERYDDLTTLRQFQQEPTISTAMPMLSMGVSTETQPLKPKTPTFAHKETKKSPNCYKKITKLRHSHLSTNSSSGVVLMPPSAFSMPEDKPTPSSPSLSVESSETEKSSSSSSTLDATSSRLDVSLSDKQDTFKTFVASPSSTRQELKIIYKKLKDFQELRDQLKVLKQQKEVLKNWIEENLSTKSTSQSLDMVTVQKEISEIEEECARISEELLVKRPEVESLAVRVRVLCARPT